MVTLERLQSYLLDWSESFLPQFFDLLREYMLRGLCRIHAVSFDADYKTSAVLQELMGVVGHYTRLVRLGNISEYHVNHGD